MARTGKQARRNAAKLIPSLGVSDIERALGFYKQFFGFKLVDSYELDGRMKWCWLRSRGADLMLQQLTADEQITLNPAIGQSWVLYIQPNDLEDTHVQLADAGFPVSDIALTAYGAREFFVSDPDGYELWISVPVAGEDDDDDDDEGIKHSNDDDEDDDDDDDEDEEEEEEGSWRV